MSEDENHPVKSRSPLLLRSLRGEKIERPPVWMMRQAGRYLAEYRAIKEKHTFLEMTKSSELALEVSLQPIRILNVDAAIVFADILTPAEALGFEIDFAPGPVVKNPIRSPGDLTRVSLERENAVYAPVTDTLRSLSKEMAKFPEPKGVIGFAGAPYTMACYLIAQGPLKHFAGTQRFIAEHPRAFSEFIKKLTTMTENYLEAQIQAGAQVVQLFDSWGGNLSAEEWSAWSLPSIKQIAEKIRSLGAIPALYVQPASHLLSEIAKSKIELLSVEWRVPLAEAARVLPEEMALQGNLDPTELFKSPEQVRAATLTMCENVSRKTRFVANLGHGILQETPRECAYAFIDTVRGIRW